MLNVDNLQEIIKSKGIKNFKNLAKETGIPYSTINYMLGGHDMYIGTLANLSNSLKEPIESFINISHKYTILKEINGKIETQSINATNIYEITAKYMM